jgi:hypothetical protein
MSNLAQLNNKANTPGVPPEATRVYPRDPDYYFIDGSTVFLVGGILFKVECTSYYT